MSIERWHRGWDPFRTLLDIQREMNRLFNTGLAGKVGEETGLMEGIWSPALDVYETESDVVVKAELPGIKPEDVNISMVGDTLTIKGERKQEEEVKKENYYRLERCYGSFQRSVRLSTDVDPNKVKATYKDGVLKITLPKSEEVKPKKIEIKAE
jgi:HSP20 family protein